MDIADINIDVPRAYSILEQFVEQSFNIGIIDVKLRDDCPCRYEWPSHSLHGFHQGRTLTPGIGTQT